MKGDQMREANQRYSGWVEKRSEETAKPDTGRPLHVNFSPPRRWWRRQCPLAQSLLGIWIQ